MRSEATTVHEHVAERYPDTYNGQPLGVVGEAIARVPPEDFIATYEGSRS